MRMTGKLLGSDKDKGIYYSGGKRIRLIISALFLDSSITFCVYYSSMHTHMHTCMHARMHTHTTLQYILSFYMCLYPPEFIPVLREIKIILHGSLIEVGGGQYYNYRKFIITPFICILLIIEISLVRSVASLTITATLLT